MEPTASGPQPPAAQDPSAGELVRNLSEPVTVLVRDELKLARLEMTRKGKQAGRGAGMLGGGGLAALLGKARRHRGPLAAAAGAIGAAVLAPLLLLKRRRR